MTESEMIEQVGRLEKHNRKLKQGAVLGVLFLALLVFMGQSGCTAEQPKQVSSPAPVIVRPYQRFVPIASGQGFLSFPYWAFDTKSGRLCKTWDWESHTAAIQKAQETGDSSRLQGFDAAAISTQTCEQLLRALPDK
jgi:hypothetical protein